MKHLLMVLVSGCLSEGGFATFALKPKLYQIIKVSGFKMMKFFLNLISKEINTWCITNLANTGLEEEASHPELIIIYTIFNAMENISI